MTTTATEQPAEGAPPRGLAYLVEPRWDGGAWRGTVDRFVRSCDPDGGDALVLHVTAPGGIAAVAGEVRAVVARSGCAQFAEVALVESPAELLETLRRFREVQRISEEHGFAPRAAPAAPAASAPQAAPAPAPLRLDLAQLAAVVRHMAVTGEGTDACLQAGALPMPVHFYSPVPDIPDLAARGVFRKRSRLAGIDFREEAQLAWLRELAAAHGQECAWPLEAPADPHAFHLRNDSFSYGCAAILHCVLRSRKPRRVIEVGSGQSSKVISAALRLNAQGGHATEYTVVDPFPAPSMASLPGLTRLVPQRVELAPEALFEALGQDDVLFIDSSHVVKTGGDVNFLFLDVLPRLAPGVIVHVHDISLPFEYPEIYFTKPSFRMFWTEAYLLQAFLACNPRFEVLLGMSYVMTDHLDVFRQAFPRWDPVATPAGSGSFWFRSKPGVTASSPEP